jgi:hypothetical protein
MIMEQTMKAESMNIGKKGGSRTDRFQGADRGKYKPQNHIRTSIFSDLLLNHCRRQTLLRVIDPYFY